VDVPGIGIDAVRGKPEGVAPEPLRPGLLLAFVRGEVGADEGVAEPSMGSYQARTVEAMAGREGVKTSRDETDGRRIARG
jgi:hypothetical protein